MRFLDFFFAINCKSRWPNEKGDIFYGVMGYSFPVTFVIFLLNQLVKRAISISLPFVLLLFLIIAILVFIYLLYRRNHYGDRIINTFEQTKFNKWYYILPICFGLQLAVLAFIAILHFYFGLIWRKSAVSETIKTKKIFRFNKYEYFWFIFLCVEQRKFCQRSRMDIEWRIWFFPTSVIHIVVDKLIPKKISYPDIGQHDSFLVYTIYIADFYILLLSA